MSFWYLQIFQKTNEKIQPNLTFSVRARKRAGAAIFVQIGAGKFSEMCVRVRAYIVFKVRTCAHVHFTFL